MAKKIRKNLKVFAGNSANTGKFGSAQAGTGVLTTDIEEIQELAAWDNGWLSAVLGGNKLPAIEEMEGVQRVLSYCLANIYQDGIPVYNSSTPYYIGSVVRQDETTLLYASLTDNNTGNLLTDTVNWNSLGDLSLLSGGADTIVSFGTVSSGSKQLTNDKFHTGNFTGSSTVIAPSISTTNVLIVYQIEFTTNSTSYPTFPDIDNWDYGATPTWSTTKKNLVTIYTYDGSTFNANYRQIGG